MWVWGVTLHVGNWQAHHAHPGANISGVYYASAPPSALDAASENGRISFYDPCPRAHMAQLFTQKTRHTEAPQPGDMVVFPSWLEHSVSSFQGEGARVCIAFNARPEMVYAKSHAPKDLARNRQADIVSVTLRTTLVRASIDLASLLSPTGVPDFLEKSWARSAFVARAGQSGRFHGLLSVAEFEFLLSTVAAPGWLSFVKDVVQPPSRDQLTSDGTLDAGALYKAITDRQSLLLTRIHRLHPGIGTLCRQVAADLRAAGVVLRKAVRANAYFTPPQSQGFAAHYDDHDVLVLQLHGEKRWRIYGEAAKWPRKPMAQPLPADFLASHAQEVTLQAGDVLYLPRGFAHEARATDQASLHVTLSVEVATWSDVFERLINLDDRLGEVLPVGFCASGVPKPSDKARAAEFSSSMMRSPALDQAIADVFNRTRNEGDFPPNGHLARIGSEAGIGPDTMLVATPGLSANFEQEGGVAILRLAGATLRADRQAVPLFRNLCEGKPFRLADLGKADDVEALLDLARELVSRGVLRAARD